jgi:hypothetical protein
MIAKGSAPEVTTENRLRGAVWGQFVGDAAALGTHWIYDLSELAARFPDGIFGCEAPAAGDYHESKKPGDQTHYGDGAWYCWNQLPNRAASILALSVTALSRHLGPLITMTTWTGRPKGRSKITNGSSNQIHPEIMTFSREPMTPSPLPRPGWPDWPSVIGVTPTCRRQSSL